MIKLILSDMDGTLLDEAGNMPAGFDDVMAQLHERGVMFAPASGRQYQSLVESFPEYADKFLFISDNGTMVRQHGQEIFSDVIERQNALRLIDSVNEIDGIYNVFCGKKKAYMLKGKVVHGFHNGRGIGFPTANVGETDPQVLLPHNGAYAVLAHVGDQVLPGMANVGYRPTMDNGHQLSIEVNPSLPAERRKLTRSLGAYFRWRRGVRNQW